MIEAGGGEGQMFRVAGNEVEVGRVFPGKGEHGGIAVDAGDLQAGLPREPARETAGAAVDVEQRLARPGAEQPRQQRELPAADPAAARRGVAYQAS